MADKIRVTIWNEYLHELEDDTVEAIYPNGIHQTIAEGIGRHGNFEVTTATLNEPEHGLSEQVLQATDVLIWWGHKAHAQVSEEVVDRAQQQILSGMGLVVLHSGHFSKLFKRILGTNCSLKWREADEKERLWNLEPSHPIMEGIPDYFELEQEEMYGERFDIPTPDKLLMISWFQGGEVFRSACTWQQGHGKVFYFRPGHETYPTYHNDYVVRIIANACKWSRRRVDLPNQEALQVEAIEPVPNPGKEHIV
ncbi:MAG: ThuA domain-containing protein [Trueperaceae bacterium]|nr:MAG: ThuA domain-containing protein [Trueperaceae bacterium]